MTDKLKETLLRHRMLSRGAVVTVALSGGADSMALLCALLSLSDELGITVKAAHVNHMLRGEESDRDEEFVRAACSRLGVELSVLKADVASQAAAHGEGLEECGRRIRYEWLEKITDGGLIATAHTLSDNLETLLFRLTRGTALPGLCGIPPVRGNIIRPLIECSRADIEKYCTENGIEYVTDSTNSDSRFARNRIRNEIVPQLTLLNPSLLRGVSKTVRSLREDEALLGEMTEKLLSDAARENGFDAAVLATAPPALRRRALVAVLKTEMREKPQFCHIDALEAILVSGGRVSTCGDFDVRVKNGILFFDRGPAPDWCVEIATGSVSLPDAEAEIEIVQKIETNIIQKVHKEVLDISLDCDKIYDKAFLRNRRPGDKIRLRSRGCTKTLKKLFSENRVPDFDRSRLIVIADGLGPVFVEGFGCAERCAVTPETKNILSVRIIKKRLENSYETYT